MKNFILLFVFTFTAAKMMAQPVLQNPGFEDWTVTTNDTIPTHWWGYQFGAGQTTNAHSGNYAAFVHNWYYYGEGVLSNGYYDVTTGGVYGTPYDEKPMYLQGYYQYDTTGNGGAVTDSGQVEVVLQHYIGNNNRDTVAKGVLKFGYSAGYKPFQVAITDLMPGIDPDTIVITFTSCIDGNCFCTGSGTGNCLYLTVDDLVLSNTTGTKSISSLFNKTKAAPNPFTAQTTIYIGKEHQRSVDATLYDIAGRKIMEWNAITTEDFTIYRDNIPSGLYLLEIQNRDETVERIKLVIE
jgi:hypothetical protein